MLWSSVGFVSPSQKVARHSPCPSVADFEERARVVSLSQLPKILDDTKNALWQQDLLSELSDSEAIRSFRHALESIPSPNLSQLSGTSFIEATHGLETYVKSLPLETSVAVAVALFAGAVTLVASARSDTASSQETRPYFSTGRYSAKDAEVYFSTRKALVTGRALRIALLSSGFGVSLLFDKALKRSDANAAQRASELVGLLTTLGPTFIKIGQSLSIRSDLLSPPYLAALAQLQDRVPAFSNDEARATVARELGVTSLSEVFSDFSADPVAAASLGQVYRGTLKAGLDPNGGGGGGGPVDVAVKVQRPGVVRGVALDMFLIRQVGPVLKRVFNLNTDIVGTVDDWGRGFVDELDYRLEAANAQEFSEKILGTPLGASVFAPRVVEEASTSRVLTTEWVVGERLEQSSAADVASLVGVCMNTYLAMLLEFGTLHCDPHPGNLLRTPDGKLCILDWGLVTQVPSSVQIKFIEHVAHLTSKDYAQVPADLVGLGFVPKGKEEAILQTECVQVLTEVYSEFAGGGGAAKIDVNFVIGRLSGLSEKYGNLFQIPPYFAYIARAFGVLEGIGLSNDPSYAIVGECLPYISQRLLTDTDPRVGGALDSFVFGSQGKSPERVLDAERLELILEGFGSYTQSTAGLLTAEEGSAGAAAPLAPLQQQQQQQQQGQEVERGGDLTAVAQQQRALSKDLSLLAEQVAALLLTEEMTPLQQLVLDQVAKVAAAGARQTFDSARRASGLVGNSGRRTVLGSVVDPFGLFSGSGLVEVDANDRKALEAAAKLGELLARAQEQQQQQRAKTGGSGGGGVVAFDTDLTPQELVVVAVEVAQKVGPLLWAKRAEAVMLGARFAGIALQQQATRLEKRRGDSAAVAMSAAADVPAAAAAANEAASVSLPSEEAEGSSKMGHLAAPHAPSSSKAPPPTERLLKARELLLDLP